MPVNIGARRRADQRDGHFDLFDFGFNFYFEMADIIDLDHAFSFHTSGESFSPELSNFLRRLSFNGEGKISASHQL